METAQHHPFCADCGAALPGAAKFCPGCGKKVGAAPKARITWTPRRALGLLSAAGIIFGVGWWGQGHLAGTAPTQSFQAPAAAPSAELSAELRKLVEAAQSRPDDIAGWKILAGALVRELQSSERPSNQVIFETMEALSNILRLDAKDPDALIAFADLSFNQQVFDKAVGLYERYLAIQPDDLNARSRYASALAFIQKFPEAVKELKSVLQKDPSNFHASAYLAITYAQMGEKAEAIALGEKTIKLAPSDDARARFSDFLTAVRSESEKTSAPEGSAQAMPDAQGEPAVVALLKKNPIAGPKFARFEANGAELKVFFRDFPMEQMPPFAKEKFFAGIRGAASGLKAIIFVDEATGRELDRIKLP